MYIRNIVSQQGYGLYIYICLDKSPFACQDQISGISPSLPAVGGYLYNPYNGSHSQMFPIEHS